MAEAYLREQAQRRAAERRIHELPRWELDLLR
jgi:hypothetical protein